MVLSELGIWAVSTIAGGIAGNQAYDKLKDMRQQTRRTFAGTVGAPADHDIDKAVASAAYQAVMVVLKDYEAAAGYGQAQDFVQALGVALRERVPLFRDPWTEPDIPTAARPHLNRLISASDGTPEAVADIGPFLTDVMLAEVTEMVGGIAVPEVFVASMRANEPNGFFPRFRAFVAQELAINDRFHRLFVATRLAEMADGVDVMRGKMERFAREAAESREISGEVHDDVREIKIKMNQAIGNNTIAEQALEMLTREKKQTERAILFFLARVFNENVQPADVVSFLYERADELAARKTEAVLVLAETPSNSNNEVDALRRAAAEALLNEDFDRNAELLEQVADLEVTNLRRKEANLAEQIQETERSRVRAVESLKARIDAQKLRGDPKATADALWALFRLEQSSSHSSTDQFEAACTAAEEWHDIGRDQGTIFHLEVCIEFAKMILTLVKTSHQRGYVYNLIGISLAQIGIYYNKSDFSKRSIEYFRFALQEWTNDQSLGAAYSNLGTVFLQLSDVEISSDSINMAISAHSMALRLQTREGMPLSWASTKNGLGSAYLKLAYRDFGIERVKAAIAAFRDALRVWTRKRAPDEWAMCQTNLGNAFLVLSQFEGGTKRLKQAISAHRAALEEWTRERWPLKWATARSNLGYALLELGERKNSKTHLKEAIIVFNDVLEVRTRDRVPFEWAQTQNNLGVSIQKLGSLEANAESIEQSIAIFQCILEEQTRDRTPREWAGIQANIGIAFWSLWKIDRNILNIETAIEAFNLSLLERTRELTPIDWAKTISDLSAVQLILAEEKTDLTLAKSAERQMKTAIDFLAKTNHTYLKNTYIKNATIAENTVNKIAFYDSLRAHLFKNTQIDKGTMRPEAS
jgi:tetratricopeptide (TPR) repeat protein